MDKKRPATNPIHYTFTYLAREIPAEVRASLPVRYVDVYIPDNQSQFPHIRLRKKGSDYEITKNKPLDDNPNVTQEHSIPLDRQEFESLATGHNRLVEKDRYTVVINSYVAEVDVFSGKLEGLVLITFAFEGEGAKQKFWPPECCLADVTHKELASGGYLAGKAYHDLTADLGELGYKPLNF